MVFQVQKMFVTNSLTVKPQTSSFIRASFSVVDLGGDYPKTRRLRPKTPLRMLEMAFPRLQAPLRDPSRSANVHSHSPKKSTSMIVVKLVYSHVSSSHAYHTLFLSIPLYPTIRLMY